MVVILFFTLPNLHVNDLQLYPFIIIANTHIVDSAFKEVLLPKFQKKNIQPTNLNQTKVFCIAYIFVTQKPFVHR
jgi:hypothetical protein